MAEGIPRKPHDDPKCRCADCGAWTVCALTWIWKYAKGAPCQHGYSFCCPKGRRA